MVYPSFPKLRDRKFFKSPTVHSRRSFNHYNWCISIFTCLYHRLRISLKKQTKSLKTPTHFPFIPKSRHPHLGFVLYIQCSGPTTSWPIFITSYGFLFSFFFNLCYIIFETILFDVNIITIPLFFIWFQLSFFFLSYIIHKPVNFMDKISYCLNWQTWN